MPGSLTGGVVAGAKRRIRLRIGNVIAGAFPAPVRIADEYERERERERERPKK